MKLIDLLVQQLTSCGDWPSVEDHPVGFPDIDGVGWVAVVKTKDAPRGPVWFQDSWIAQSTENKNDQVTREQYEAALAASNQESWNGEGLPPVGCECEYQSESDGWVECEVLMYHKTVVILDTPISGGSLTVARLDGANFRAAPTVADKRREEFATSLCSHLDDLTDWDSPVCKFHALAIYDAIAAGKIKGVKLDDL